MTNFKLTKEHIAQTILDTVALLPIVGGVKYVDEAGALLKSGAKYGDEIADTAKTINKAKSISSITDNLDNVIKKYKLNDSGYFGDKGKNCRVIKSDDPIKTSADFYKEISQGGSERTLPNGKGVQTIFDDTSSIVYRVETSTHGSPAVSIHVMSSKKIKTQKIHFIEE